MRSTCVGMTSSLRKNFTPSATAGAGPTGPTRFGPMRSCIQAETLRSANDQVRDRPHDDRDDADDDQDGVRRSNWVIDPQVRVGTLARGRLARPLHTRCFAESRPASAAKYGHLRRQLLPHRRGVGQARAGRAGRGTAALRSAPPPAAGTARRERLGQARVVDERAVLLANAVVAGRTYFACAVGRPWKRSCTTSSRSVRQLGRSASSVARVRVAAGQEHGLAPRRARGFATRSNGMTSPWKCLQHRLDAAAVRALLRPDGELSPARPAGRGRPSGRCRPRRPPARGRAPAAPAATSPLSHVAGEVRFLHRQERRQHAHDARGLLGGPGRRSRPAAA